MNTNQIPPGVKAFKAGGNIVTCAGKYEDWVTLNLNVNHPIITISVDGKQWSVGDDTNEGTIRRFYYQHDNWCAETEVGRRLVNKYLTTPPFKDSGGEEYEKQLDHMVSQGKAISTPINPSEPEEDDMTDMEMLLHQRNSQLEIELQSLQAYNGKLVKVLEKIIRIAEGNNRMEDIAWRNAKGTAQQALSSFTDKEIKTSGK